MRIVVATLILVGLVVLQGAVGHYIAIMGVKPDLALLALLFFANRGGRGVAQVGGFASGLVADFLSLSPLGFYALSRTLLGFMYGLSAGKIFVDPLLIPMLFAGTATLLKALFYGLLSAVFSLPPPVESFFSIRMLVELGYNMLVAPLAFGLLGLVGGVVPPHRREFGT